MQRRREIVVSLRGVQASVDLRMFTRWPWWWCEDDRNDDMVMNFMIWWWYDGDHKTMMIREIRHAVLYLRGARSLVDCRMIDCKVTDHGDNNHFDCRRQNLGEHFVSNISKWKQQNLTPNVSKVKQQQKHLTDVERRSRNISTKRNHHHGRCLHLHHHHNDYLEDKVSWNDKELSSW